MSAMLRSAAAGIVLVLLSGCAPGTNSVSTTPTPIFVTSTLPATAVPSPTLVPPSPPPTATPPPIKGITSTQVYVRKEPNSAADELGLLGPATRVDIVGKDPSGNWLQLIYPAGGSTLGWVAAQYVVTTDKEVIPVAADPELDSSAVVTQLVNVRDGPGLEFESAGTLHPNDVVILTARDSSSTWVQVRFPAATDGLGWISALYVQAAGLESLPVAAGAATPTAGPESGTPLPTPSATAAPAADDGDSPEQPAMTVKFSPLDAGGLRYTSSVSSPTGDAADWIAFVPYGPDVQAQLSCMGTGNAEVEISTGGTPLSGWIGMSCGQRKMLAVTPGQSYLVKVAASSANGALSNIRYTLGVDGQP